MVLSTSNDDTRPQIDDSLLVDYRQALVDATKSYIACEDIVAICMRCLAYSYDCAALMYQDTPSTPAAIAERDFLCFTMGSLAQQVLDRHGSAHLGSLCGALLLVIRTAGLHGATVADEFISRGLLRQICSIIHTNQHRPLATDLGLVCIKELGRSQLFADYFRDAGVIPALMRTAQNQTTSHDGDTILALTNCVSQVAHFAQRDFAQSGIADVLAALLTYECSLDQRRPTVLIPLLRSIENLLIDWDRPLYHIADLQPSYAVLVPLLRSIERDLRLGQDNTTLVIAQLAYNARVAITGTDPWWSSCECM